MRSSLLALLSLVACGDDGVRHIIDAPQSQQGDGPQIDAAPAPVRLTVTLDGTPQSGVHVYFQNADSSVVLATTTDATGTAAAVMVAGGYVTALSPFPQAGFQAGLGGPPDVNTFAGVKPGDHLVLTQSDPAFSSIDLTIPSVVDVTQYSIATTCQGPPNSGQGKPNYLDPQFLDADGSGDVTMGDITLFGCTGATDVLVAAETTTGTPTNFFYVPNRTFTDGEMVDLSGQDFSQVVPRDYTYNNVPATIPFITIEDTSLSGHGVVYQSYGGNTYGDTTITTELGVPTFTGASDIVEADANTGVMAIQHMVDWGPYATTYTTDVGARLLPNMTAAATEDVTSHTISWTEDAGGVTPDFVVTGTFVARSSDERSWAWAMASPRSGVSVKLPTLPTDVYDYNIGASDQATVGGVLLGKITGGYDAVRAGLLSLDGPTGLITTATGTLTYEDTLPPVTQTSGRRKHHHATPTHRLTHRRL